MALLVADALRRMAPHRLLVHPCRQLVPELAPLVASAARLVLIDATVRRPPGEVAVRRIRPGAPHRTGGHELSPQALLEAAACLTPRLPQVWLVTIGAQDFAYGRRVSAAATRAVGRAASQVLTRLGVGSRSAHQPPSRLG